MKKADIKSHLDALSPERRAAALERARARRAGANEDPALALPPLRPAAGGGAAPLSFAQERLWFLDQLTPGTATYNIPLAYRLRGPLDAPALERALNALVSRHEVLRTTVSAIQGRPLQVVAPPFDRPLPVVDLTALAAEVREERAHALAGEEARRPFDLSEGPVLRAQLLRLDGQDHLFQITLHHLASDGWSLGVLTGDLSALYDALLGGRAPTLRPLPVQYADYAAWQRGWLTGKLLDQQLAYWKNKLAGAPPALELPTDRPRPRTLGSRGGSRIFELSPELTRDLKGLSRARGTTLYMTLLAGFRVLLARYSGQPDIVVGSAIAGRTAEELEGLIGFFVNTLVLRTEVAPDAPFQELLHRERDTILAAFAHQDVPFESLVEALRTERDPSRTPLVQVMFILNNVPQRPLALSGLAVSPVELHTTTAKFDLELSVEEAADRLIGRFEYNAELFEASTLERLADHYRIVLEEAVRSPGAPTREIASRIPVQTLEVRIASTFTAEPVRDSLGAWLSRFGVPHRLVFAPYAQLFQALLDEDSVLGRDPEGVSILLVRLEDWADNPGTLFDERCSQLIDALRVFRSRNQAPLWLFFTPGDGAFDSQRRRIGGAAAALGLFVADFSKDAERYAVPQRDDQYSDELGHVPYTPAFFSVMGMSIARRIVQGTIGPCELIIVDADEALWRLRRDGDGAAVVEIDASAHALQTFMRARLQAGIRLCLRSQEPEPALISVFRSQRQMPLRLSDLASWRADEALVSEQVTALAREQGVLPERVVFLSRNAMICRQLRESYPEIMAFELPEDPATLDRFLNRCALFDREGGAIEGR